MDNLKPLQDAVERILLDPSNHDLLALVKAVRNGIVYGVKIRFPHALVMTVLFRSNLSMRAKALAVFAATRQHATNLALFALVYKTAMLALRATTPLTRLTSLGPRKEFRAPALGAAGRRESSADAFLAGLLAGWTVFGRAAPARSSVTQQIVIYVFARAVLGLAKLAVAPREKAPRGFQAGYAPVGMRGGGLLDGLFKSVGGGTDEGTERVRRAVLRNAWPVFASVSWGTVMWLFRWYPDLLQPSLKSSMTYLYDNAEQWDGVKNFIWHNL